MSTAEQPLLKVEDLSKRYGPGCHRCPTTTGPRLNRNLCPHCHTVWAYQRISFDLYACEVLGIVGESGSGKSTLLKLLYFDSEPTMGRMRLAAHRKALSAADGIQDQDCFALSAFQKRQLRNTALGIVYQHPTWGCG